MFIKLKYGKQGDIMTKHNKIINYIKGLVPGAKISVRGVSTKLNVSEGTAYRAIKEAEVQGYVNTIPRVGTIRVENRNKKDIEKFTYSEIVNIVGGTCVAGKNGLYKRVNKLIIGAMTPDAMVRYISPGDILIIGNRVNAQRVGLAGKCGLLITGGFKCTPDIEEEADNMNLPVILTDYDTFTASTLINRAIYFKMRKKEILLVKDIMVKSPLCLKSDDGINMWKDMVLKTGHTRFPVINNSGDLAGIITARDVADTVMGEYIGDIMKKNLFAASVDMTVAYAAHTMVWQGIELMPVIDGKKLVGIITREDVIKALQFMYNQPQVEETIEDLLLKNFEANYEKNKTTFSGTVPALMLSYGGMASFPSLSLLMATAGLTAVIGNKRYEAEVESFNIFYTRPIQIDQRIDIVAEVIEMSRNFGKVEITVSSDQDTLSRGILSVRMFKSR
jgi:predicted transcriptional regulator